MFSMLKLYDLFAVNKQRQLIFRENPDAVNFEIHMLKSCTWAKTGVLPRQTNVKMFN